MRGQKIAMPVGFRIDLPITNQKIKPGMIRRIATYAYPYRKRLLGFLAVTSLNAVITIVNPLLLREIIDRGILFHDEAIVVTLAIVMAAIAIFGAFLSFAVRWFSACIGQGLIYDMRTEVFDHVQRQPIAFFARTQTGSLVSRLDADVVGAQQAITSILSTTISSILSLIVVLVAMFYLSWLASLIALALVPMFIVPTKLLARKLQQLTRESMMLDAEMGSIMTERFNVAGAMLVKLFGRPREESVVFADKARKVRDIGIIAINYDQVFFVAFGLLGALATAVVYGVGGSLVIAGSFQLGSLVALAALLTRIYSPISSLSNAQTQVMTALVSFDRIFEVLDLEPLIKEKPSAVTLPRTDITGGIPDITFDHVSFRYPTAAEVSLASLESVAVETPDGQEAPEKAETERRVLCDISFCAPSGRLTALVGPSGAGKTTISYLVSRLYDPDEGAVRIAGHDVRDVTLESLHSVVGVVSQDPHMFHGTIRSNLLYARPGATDAELAEACQAAQIWNLITGLPGGLDTVVGDRGYRLSGGERQRVALARLLLKAPSVIVLDEATSHLDLESEAAVQRALKVTLAGRTSLVIAHRLSTIREADQILVVESGQIVERGRHEALLSKGGLYADLYRIQFASQERSLL